MLINKDMYQHFENISFQNTNRFGIKSHAIRMRFRFTTDTIRYPICLGHIARHGNLILSDNHSNAIPFM